MAKVIVIQPDEVSPPGLIGAALEAAGLELQQQAIGPDGGLADVPDGAGLLLLGGPQSVTDPDQRRLVDDCTRAIRRYHGAGRPVFGICLGAQLIAEAFGTPVHRLDRMRFGLKRMLPGAEAAGDGLVGAADPAGPCFVWHEDGFDLPAGAVPLLQGEDHGPYAFRIGPATYGFQCHLEVTLAGVRRMVERGGHLVERNLGAEGAQRLATLEQDMARHMPAAEAFGTAVGQRWAALVTGAAQARGGRN